MAVTRIHVRAPRQHVFDVLTDASAYKVWVVGCKRIRGVDATWPAPGSKFHHVVGWGPISDHDTSEVLEIDPPRRLVLEARVWPLGTARVELQLLDAGNGTDVVMIEEPLRGLAKRLNNRLGDVAIRARNAVAVRRLRDWAEQRYHAIPGVPMDES